jgi:hypothetical protein
MMVERFFEKVQAQKRPELRSGLQIQELGQSDLQICK